MVLKDIENILSKNIKILSYEVKISYIILFLIFIFVASGCTLGCSSKLCLGDFKGLLSNTREYMENRVNTQNTQNQKNMEEALASQKREQEKMREQQRIREQQRKIKEMQEHQKRQRLLQEQQKKSENQLAKKNKATISRSLGTPASSALANLAGL